MTVQSFTDSKVTYETTEHNCTCGDWQFRGSKTGKDCKHMVALKRGLAQEIAKVERFLAIKAHVERVEIERRENASCYLRMMASPW